MRFAENDSARRNLTQELNPSHAEAVLLWF